MTLTNKNPKADPGRSAGAEPRRSAAKPVSGLFRTLYKWWKYATIISVVVGIVIAGLIVLGDVSEEVGSIGKVAKLYEGSDIYSEAAEGIGKLLSSKKSTYVSNKAVNFYLQQKIDDKSDSEREKSGSEKDFADLEHFAEYFMSKRYEGENWVRFSLRMYKKNWVSVVGEPLSWRGLRWLKGRVEELMRRHDWGKDENVKELKWSRVKKLLEGGKLLETIELIKRNLVNWTWEWVETRVKVIVLVVDECGIKNTNEGIIEKNKKLLKRWIEEHEDQSEIIILSRSYLNNLYDGEREDIFKAYQVDTNMDNFGRQNICKYLNQNQGLTQAQCDILRSNFGTLNQMVEFLHHNKQVQPTAFRLSSNQEEVQGILQDVCNKGTVKYYFYENQQNANKVLEKSKKGKKSRLDREMDALLVKFSQLKHFLGINKVKDVLNTLNTPNDKNGLSLSELNEQGLYYEFEKHELRWRDEYERIGYEMRTERRCKGEEGNEGKSESGKNESGKEQGDTKREEVEINEQEEEQVEQEQVVEEQGSEDEEYEEGVNYMDREQEEEQVDGQIQQTDGQIQQTETQQTQTQQQVVEQTQQEESTTQQLQQSQEEQIQETVNQGQQQQEEGEEEDDEREAEEEEQVEEEEQAEQEEEQQQTTENEQNTENEQTTESQVQQAESQKEQQQTQQNQDQETAQQTGSQSAQQTESQHEPEEAQQLQTQDPQQQNQPQDSEEQQTESSSDQQQTEPSNQQQETSTMTHTESEQQAEHTESEQQAEQQTEPTDQTQEQTQNQHPSNGQNQSQNIQNQQQPSSNQQHNHQDNHQHNRQSNN